MNRNAPDNCITPVSNTPDVLDADMIRSLAGPGLLSELILLSETDSTNNVLKDLATKGASHGTVVIADYQTLGRGRQGRSFFSPRGTGIYMSILLRPDLELQKSVRITSMAAVAVARAIRKLTGLEAKIKWVNDIFIHNKKVCGILTEASPDTVRNTLNYAVLGIGINVGPVTFPEELQTIATSIQNECSLPVTRNALIAQILSELAASCHTLQDGSFLEESKQYSILLGKEIDILGENGKRTRAKAVDLDSYGHLIVEINGKKELLHSGEVSVRL